MYEKLFTLQKNLLDTKFDRYTLHLIQVEKDHRRNMSLITQIEDNENKKYEADDDENKRIASKIDDINKQYNEKIDEYRLKLKKIKENGTELGLLILNL